MSGRCRRAAEFDPALYLDEPTGEEACALREHARGCGDCRQELAAWEALRAELVADDTHPQPERLLAYADRRDALAPDDARLVSEHLLLCASCRDEVGVLERVRIEPAERPAPSPIGLSTPVKRRAAGWMAQLLAGLRRPALAYAAIILLAVPLLALWALRASETDKLQIARMSSYKSATRAQQAGGARLAEPAPLEHLAESAPPEARIEAAPAQPLRVLGALDTAGVSDQQPVSKPAELAASVSSASERASAVARAAPAAQAPLGDGPSAHQMDPTAVVPPPAAAAPAPSPAAETPKPEPEEPAVSGAMMRAADESQRAVAALSLDDPVLKTFSVAGNTIDFRPGTRDELDRADLADGFMLRVTVATAGGELEVKGPAGARSEDDAAAPIIVVAGGSTLEVRVFDLSTRADVRHRRRVDGAAGAGRAVTTGIMAMERARPRSDAMAERRQPATQVIDVWVDVERLGPGPYRIEIREEGASDLLAAPMELGLRKPD